MHDGVKAQLADWYTRHADRLFVVADVGAFNLNGSVSDVIPGAVGFDIMPGPGVDEVLLPGRIPWWHRGRFHGVASISAMQFCPYRQLFKAELVDLLEPGGLVFLSMCRPQCNDIHNSSGAFGWRDSVRLSASDLCQLLAPEFTVDRCETVCNDIIYEGHLA